MPEKKTVLLVDPDPDVRQMLEKLVGKDRLLVADDFVGGWRLFEDNRHDLCLVVVRAKIEGMHADVFVALVRQIGGFKPILVNSGDPMANFAMIGPKMATDATDGTDLVSSVARLL